MKLFRAKHKDYGTWFFTTKAKMAKYINTSPNYLDHCLIVERTCKDWTVEDVSDSEERIPAQMLNPERKYI